MPLAADVPAISRGTLRLFTLIARRYFRRHFRSVLIQHPERLRMQGPAIVFANHSSWWDPLLLILLARSYARTQRHYAPMDAVALARYRIFRRLGIFGVEMNSARGAAQFLRTAEAILRSGGVLWLTPQARFADVRTWPLHFKPGLAALAARMPEVPLIPMAVEYTFWDERLPETLVHVGPALTAAQIHEPEARTEGQAVGSSHAAAQGLTRELEAALAEAMMTLQKASVARDPRAFEPVLQGARGTGGVYGLFRRIGAALTGRTLQQDHTAR